MIFFKLTVNNNGDTTPKPNPGEQEEVKAVKSWLQNNHFTLALILRGGSDAITIPNTSGKKMTSEADKKVVIF